MKVHDAQEPHDHVQLLSPDSPSVSAFLHAANVWRRRHTLPAARAALPRGTRRGESLSAQTVGALSSAPRQTHTCDGYRALHPGLAVPLVRLATSLGRRSTRDLFPLAPPARRCVVVPE